MAPPKIATIRNLEALGSYLERRGIGSIEPLSCIRDVGPPLPAKRKPPAKRSGRIKIPDQVVREVRELRKTYTYDEIARRLNVRTDWVAAVCTGVIRSNVK